MYRMNRYQIFCIGILLFCTLFQTGLAEQASDNPDESIEISLERGMCFGTCPVYSVTLYGNGTISWVGNMYVETIGNASGYTDPTLVQDLYHHIARGGFFDFEDAYTAYNITDMPSAVLTVRSNTTTKQIDHYHGDFTAPKNLTLMEDAVDAVANTSRWIGTISLDGGTQGEPI